MSSGHLLLAVYTLNVDARNYTLLHIASAYGYTVYYASNKFNLTLNNLLTKVNDKSNIVTNSYCS